MEYTVLAPVLAPVLTTVDNFYTLLLDFSMISWLRWATKDQLEYLSVEILVIFVSLAFQLTTNTPAQTEQDLTNNGRKINKPKKNFHIWAASWQNQQCGCEPSEDSDQPGHPPSLIRVFAVRMKKAWVLSYPLSAQRRLWSDWTDAQADLSLRLAHMSFCLFCHEAAHLWFYNWSIWLRFNWGYFRKCDDYCMIRLVGKQNSVNTFFDCC